MWKPIPNNSITPATPYNVKPQQVMMDGICQAGCYTPDQAVLFGPGSVPIREAQETGLRDVITLAPDATAESVSFMRNTVASFVFDKVDSYQDILTFRTESGGELKVTLEHPLMTQDGALHPARQVYEAIAFCGRTARPTGSFPSAASDGSAKPTISGRRRRISCPIFSWLRDISTVLSASRTSSWKI